MGKVKTNKAKVYDSVRPIAIKWVADKYKVSREYVRAAIYGTCKGGRTDELKKAFDTKYAELKAVIK